MLAPAAHAEVQRLPQGDELRLQPGPAAHGQSVPEPGSRAGLLARESSVSALRASGRRVRDLTPDIYDAPLKPLYRDVLVQL